MALKSLRVAVDIRTYCAARVGRIFEVGILISSKFANPHFDAEGIERSIRFPAESLDKAAIETLTARKELTFE